MKFKAYLRVLVKTGHEEKMFGSFLGTLPKKKFYNIFNYLLQIV